MSKVVFVEEHKVDNRTTLHHIVPCKTVNDVTDDTEAIHVFFDKPLLIDEAMNHKHNVYVPFRHFRELKEQDESTFVYFDLENYPFYHSVKTIMNEPKEINKQKGVFRYRRTVKKSNEDTLIGDLYVIFSLFGNPVNIHVKQTNQSIVPAHTIIMVNFGDGILAHIEYTIASNDRIEWEWSGIRKIIEFDSDKMRPFEPQSETKLPLLYSVDSILKTATPYNKSLINELNEIKAMLDGGTTE